MKHNDYSSVSMDLKAEDPFERLKEMCKLGKYHYKFIYHHYQNGYMIKLALSILPKKTEFTSVCTFVETDDLAVARKTVASVLLNRLNLAPKETEEDDIESLAASMNVMTEKIFSRLTDGMKELEEKKPLSE
jgi:phage terminase large subunit-like protein